MLGEVIARTESSGASLAEAKDSMGYYTLLAID